MALSTKLQNRIAQTREQRERGAVLVLTALVMLLLLFIAAFATDLGAWHRQGQEQQRAADVGALNGVQAYDSAVKKYFADLSVAEGFNPPIKDWSDTRLSADNLRAAEEAGLRAAANTVIALLEASGLEFTDIGTGILANDPLDHNQVSTWTIVAVDGTEVIITRSFVVTGKDSMGNDLFARAVDVQVVAPGEQYFSNIVRDAPQIERSATSVLSNCGAVCDNQVEISPPFAGFNASGRGDGFTPLLFNKDGNQFNGYEEIWAVNHHIDHADGVNSAGDIICMDAATRMPCTDANQFNLETLYRDLQTPNRPQEYIDEDRGLILFAARDAGLNKTGVACWDARDRTWCDTRFVPMFDANQIPVRWGGWINATGPFVNQAKNQVYMFAQDGTWACASLNGNGGMTANCGSGDSPAITGTGKPLPGIDDPNFYISHGEQIGDRVYVRMPTTGGGTGTSDQRIFCVTLSAGMPNCPGWGGATTLNNYGYHGDNEVTTLAYGTDGVPYGICALNLGADRHKCVSLSNGAVIPGNIPNLNNLLAATSGNWGGDAFAWFEPGTDRVLTLIAGGQSNKVGCYDWAARDHCAAGVNGTLTTDHAFHGLLKDNGNDLNHIAPYAFARISAECVIGLSHASAFFSFDPVSFTPCVDTQVNTQITPCECADGAGNRWGEVRIPAGLLALTARLDATISATQFGPAIAGIDDVDLKATDGLLDLSSIQDSDIVEYHDVNGDGELQPVVYLRLSVDALLINGAPAWTSTFEADLQLVVQPTLQN